MISFLNNQKILFAIMGALAVCIAICAAQDYDDEGYGNQGNNNQNDGDNYGGGYNDDGYNNNMPNYQQNVDSEGTQNTPSNYNMQGGNDADGDYEGDDGSAAAAAAASSVVPSVVRVRRSVSDSSSEDSLKVASTAPKLRVKRHGKYYIGPVYTYVKTDKHANFKWGVSR